jgi:hypothetical protein
LLTVMTATVVACAGSASGPANDPVGQDRLTGGGGGQAAASAAPAAPGEAPEPSDGVGNQLLDDARIVRTGTMELEVTDVGVALQTARDGIRAMGGYVGASQTETVDDRPFATVTYRVPVDRWDAALDLLHRLAGQTTKVVTERTEAVEVTGTVVDLEARIRNLRSSEAALQAISARTTRITDVLEVQGQLTTVRGQIEQLTAQLTELEDRAAYATMTVSYSTPIPAVEVATERWEPRTVVDEASASLVDILQSLTTAGIWFAIVWLPVLLMLGLVGLAVVAVLRRLGVARIGARGGDVAASG